LKKFLSLKNLFAINEENSEFILVAHLVSFWRAIVWVFKTFLEENTMSFWQILGNFAFSDSGESVHKISDSLSISTDGTSYTTMGLTTVGSDGSVFIQQGVFSSDGSTRMGSVATGLGAVFGRH
jgi:hypothetical protein